MKKWLCVLLLAALVCALPALAAARVINLSEIDLNKLSTSSDDWIYAKRFADAKDVIVIRQPDAEHELTGTLPDECKDFILRLEVKDGTKITLNNAEICACMEIGSDTTDIKNYPEEQVTLHLKGEKNSIEVITSDGAITCYTSLTITAKENAKLKVSNHKGSGIGSNGDLVIEGGDIDIDVGENGLGMGHFGSKFTLNGGNVTINAGVIGVYHMDGLQPEMNGGSLNITVPPTSYDPETRPFTAAVAVLEDGKEPHPLKLGKPANLPGFIGWNVNGTIMQPGDELVTLAIDEKFHPTFVIRDLSITPVFAFPAAPSVPKTGDSANIALWLGLLAVSAMGAIILSRKAKKA